MNIFNRIIMIILLFLLIISSVVVVVNIFTNLYQWQDVFDRILNFIEETNIYIVTAAIIAIIIVSLVILIFEFYRRKIKTTNVAQVKGGRAMITLKSAAQQIEEDLEDVRDISSLKVNVVSKSGGAIINIYAKLFKGGNVSEKMQEVIKEANKSAIENLGVKVIRTNFTATGFLPKPEYVTIDELEEEKELKHDKVQVPDEPEDTLTTEDQDD
jgi:hypothetical protein